MYIDIVPVNILPASASIRRYIAELVQAELTVDATRAFIRDHALPDANDLPNYDAENEKGLGACQWWQVFGEPQLALPRCKD